MQNAKYLVCSEGYTDFLPYSDAREKIDEMIKRSGKDTNGHDVLQNHVISHAIGLCLQITTGMVIDENTFRVDNKLPSLIMDSDAVKALPDLLDGLPEDLEGFFEDDVLKSTDKILEYYSDMTVSEIHEILAAFESRLLSGPTIPASTVAIRLFDRVFNFITHPNQFVVQTTLAQNVADTPGLKEVPGSSPQKFKINMEESPLGNLLYNDHIGSYAYDVEV